jgi:lysozyme family protein
MTRTFLAGIFFFLLSTAIVRGQDVGKHADFAIAYHLMLPKEGGYVNSKQLKGGETYRGINRRSHPKWEGWHTIDQHKMKYEQVLPELETSVETFYHEHYWDAINGDALQDQKTANTFFYLAVKKGTDRAIMIKERSVGMRSTGEVSDELIKRINQAQHHTSSKPKRKHTKKRKGHH